MQRIFILSPAFCGGTRAGWLLTDGSRLPLAAKLREAAGAPLGEVFSFVSGLYFRGKATYARAFARPPAKLAGVLVITATDGLCELDEPVTIDRLRAFAGAGIDLEDRRYRRPLERDARRLASAAGADSEIVLLGSVATPKYVGVLSAAFGERLRFPPAFIGRGDMSRGGLLLRCVDDGRELEYAGLAGAVLHGPRPPRLEARR